MKTKQAVILAGGKGTRLKDRLDGLPKPLIDLCGKPLLERQIDFLKSYGYNNIKLLVNHRAEIIREYCVSKGNFGLNIDCIDDGEPRGTAGSILQILPTLESRFLVVYGDTMFNIDLRRFEEFHEEIRNIDATLFLHPNDHPQDSDLVEIDNNSFIKFFHPYPHKPGIWLPNLVNAALYIMKRDALFSWVGMEGLLDFGKDIFPKMLDKKCELRGYVSPEYIKDVGTPARIDKVRADFLSGKIQRASLKHEQKAVFVDRDGTINVEVNHLTRPDQFEIFPKVDEAIKRLNQAEYRVCVVTNQPVIARGECTIEELKSIHNKMETLLGNAGAFVDRIDFCPHHPDKGYEGEIAHLKKICTCRKPEIGMIKAAIEALNISSEVSWMIGDTSSDILAAKRANLKSVLVQTGYAGLDEKYKVNPDFIVPDLAVAVDLILSIYPKIKTDLIANFKAISPGDVVFIGGRARSGKSTIATVLKDCLCDMGVKSHILQTDRWIKSKEYRGYDVLKRHYVDELQLIINKLTARKDIITLDLPFYSKKSRLNTKQHEKIEIIQSDVIIVEGVIALGLASNVSSSHRLFVKLDEDMRRSRFLHEYYTRDESLQAEVLYKQRLEDECNWVDSTCGNAVVIDMNRYALGA